MLFDGSFFETSTNLIRIRGFPIDYLGHAQHYLPIGIVGIDDVKDLALIELPHESDSGISRLWVRRSDLR